jgi:hypothetical protein
LYGAFNELTEETKKELWKARQVLYGERLPRAIYVDNAQQQVSDTVSVDSDAGSEDEIEDDSHLTPQNDVGQTEVASNHGKKGKKQKKSLLKEDIEKEMTRFLRRRDCYKDYTDAQIAKEVEDRYGNTHFVMRLYFLGFKKMQRTLSQTFTRTKLKEVFYFESFLAHFYYTGLDGVEIWPKDPVTGKRGNFVDPSKDEHEIMRVLPLHFCKKHWAATFMADQMCNNNAGKLRRAADAVSILLFSRYNLIRTDLFLFYFLHDGLYCPHK